MATNITEYLLEYVFSVAATDPATPSSGDPVRFGELTGLALTDEGDGGNISTETTVYFGPGKVNYSVKAIDDSGNSPVAVGDTLYYTDADTPKISKKASGYFVGFALAIVPTGTTVTISVLTLPAGSFTGTVNTGDIAAGAVTAAKLSTTLKTGTIQMPLVSWREVGTNDIQALAAHGGILAKDSTPILEFTNLDTDSAIRAHWAAADVNAITLQVVLPQDVDVASNLTIHMRAAMNNTNDTPIIDADTFFNEGDTKVSDASAAITGTTVAEYTITIAAADVPAGAQTMSIELTPQAHGTDALFVYALWAEYTRK